MHNTRRRDDILARLKALVAVPSYRGTTPGATGICEDSSSRCWRTSATVEDVTKLERASTNSEEPTIMQKPHRRLSFHFFVISLLTNILAHCADISAVFT